jgi:hypothetical protein
MKVFVQYCATRRFVPSGLIFLWIASSGLLGCTEQEPGTLVVRWRVTSPIADDPSPCNTASIQQIHIQVTADPTLPETEWPLYRFACSLGEVELQLAEGLYTVKIFKAGPNGETAVRTLTDVQVLSNAVRDWAGPYPPDPADAHDIDIFWCGNGVRETAAGEECDEGLENSADTPDACRPDCVLPFCGDGVADSDESCDGSDLKSVTCADLDLAGDTPGCTAACELDASMCLEPAADLTLTWSVYNSDATALSDCESENISYVRYQIRPRLESEILTEGITACASALTTVADLEFDVYTIYLEGLSAAMETIASGFIPTHNHNLIAGTTVDASLVPVATD